MDQGVIAWLPGSGKGGSADGNAPVSAPRRIFFDRRELDTILGLYGRMVAAGEWRDYAMADGVEVAVFAVHRRSSEQPLYRIEKRPALARKQGAYAVVAAGGRVLKRGHDLGTVLAVLERKLVKLVEGD
ncbi:DUF2794 domain-containing protein [Zavarzinia compransoris]|uniref:DUF2794 domain-containing protein n=1 Tax=Zavarzinia compransoris TaxID=1264899 RepID=A0A317E6L6_9PROT|nr:DUF2794 domain-containing protein [Zavarzinia compransoris]PWR22261.1 DUF2794 domain-containing protein [Zavarzinia compransoris]TDP46979.1 uncharacterized protein DUF2794 [Zavarzinia compransoris]